MSGLVALSTVLHDAWRGLRVGRGTTALAFLILTLAMAAATVTFSVVDGVALRPLPYASPDRLDGISRPGPSPGAVGPVTPHDYFSWLEEARTLESIAAARFIAPLRLEDGASPETLSAMAITANLFDVLGVRPVIGGFFDAEHERSGGPAAVILGYDLWKRRFAADPGVIGRHLQVGGEAREVIGVLPPGVWYPMTAASPPDLYLPYVVTPAERSNDWAAFLAVVGRLGRGVSIEQARADVERLGSAVVLPLHERVVGSARTWLLLVLAAVGLVLLIACGNVANLLLARATTRVPELATREALGASRRRLAAGLVVEGLILALSATAAGVLVSYWGVGIVTSRVPEGLLTRLDAVSVDGRVLAVSVAAALVCGLLFSCTPAWLAARSDLAGHMKAGGGSVAGGRRRDRSLAAFLVAQIAVVSVLLVATTLVVTSFILITTADLGFDRRNVMLIGFQQAQKGIAEADRPAAAAVLRDHLLDRARAVPGVTAAAITFNDAAPMSGGSVRYGITVPGVGEVRGDDAPDTHMVTPEYFRVMGMQLVGGRLFDLSDGASAPAVMVINDVAAR